ncbi:unnamed protein product [Blepharisma stoltei]|uniref:Uncharacterized protein n=1 Tax=Blepharisma stoltei TaxID=1481888 RepID=A0AAU9K2I1_9CILI|nr:unnamed protein product [Blepharisma stoltei]
MSNDQLEEYRRRMQQKRSGTEVNRDEELAKALQEEENERLRKQASEDEEIAKKMQSQNLDSVQSSNPQNQPVYPVPWGRYQAPPPYQAPPAQPRENPYYAPLPGHGGENQPLLGQNIQTHNCLPQVNDKFLGVNTQVCVLTTAGLLTFGIIATLIIMASS